ncbi:MAG TPA: DUF881 domain-containing protein [Candidatus Limnocylindrales bacterium]|nr:DUF881 domain-containing protein [Candidatus Limnocylindrales bacterium]
MTAVGARLRAIPSWQVTLGLALLALGFLIAAQLSSEGPRVRYTTQERSPLIETVTGLQGQQDGLKSRILDLRSKIQAAELRGQGSAALVRKLNDQLQQARIAAGLVPLSGTGVVFQLDDSTQRIPAGGNAGDYLVTAQDIRTVVEELWLAGAEAMSVNGERLTTSSAIVDIGGSVLINSAFVAGPYQISAIGPKDLYDRVSASRGFAEFLRARAEAHGIGVSFYAPQSIDVPAFAGTVTLRFARTVPSSSPSPSSPP